MANIHRRNDLAVDVLDLLLHADVQLYGAALRQITRKNGVQRVQTLHDNEPAVADIELSCRQCSGLRCKIVLRQKAGAL